MAITLPGLPQQMEREQYGVLSQPQLQQPAQPQQQPGFLNSLGNLSPKDQMLLTLAGNVLKNVRKNPMEAFGEAIQPAMQQQMLAQKLFDDDEEKKRKERARLGLGKWLGQDSIAQEMGPGWMELVNADAELARQVYADKQRPEGSGTGAIQNFQKWQELSKYDAEHGTNYAGEFKDIFVNRPQQPKEQGSGRKGNIQYGLDEKGQPIYGFPNPEAGKVDWADSAGNPYTGKVEIMDPGSMAGRKKQLQIQSEAKANLPAFRIDTQRSVERIDDFLADPDLEKASGIEGWTYENAGPTWATIAFGGAVPRLASKYDQMMGIAFKTAFETLKGGGHITEYESQMAAKALQNMARAQSDEDFKIAVLSFRDAIITGLRKMEATAAGDSGGMGQGEEIPGLQEALDMYGDEQ